MRNVILVLLPVLILSAFAQERRNVPPRPVAHEPRAKGVAQHGTWRHFGKPGQTVRVQVYHDHRNLTDIRRDPHVVVFNHVNWHPVGHWERWHRDWGPYWRVVAWRDIQTVTCEAVDTQTELLYPVTEAHGDWYWSSDLVNNVADRALDECATESGHPESCVLVQQECWNSEF